MLNRCITFLLVIIFFPYQTYAQERRNDSAAAAPIVSSVAIDTGNSPLFTLKQCIQYALKNQPDLQQSVIDQAVAHDNNLIALSGWLPQVNGSAYYDHYFQGVSVATGVPQRIGPYDVSSPGVTATQTIFSPDVLLAVRASKLNTLHAKQNVEYYKIQLVSDVSKAFYTLLNSLEQTVVLREDTARLIKNQSDAYHRYVAGTTDKVDYKQATISLNNSLASLKTATEAVKAKYALLKQAMGMPSNQSFRVDFDTTQMMQEVYRDTTEPLAFEKRIEYKLQQTNRLIAHETTLYYELGFIPTLSASYNYNALYESTSFGQLYSTSYPTSYFGVQLNVPLFTGFRRWENVHKSKLLEKRVDLDDVNLHLQIYSEYEQAMANYKSNLFNLHAMGDNVSMGREVYDIVKLQYREGIKAYLDVIVAESDLESAEINYLNALFQLLSSKVDLEKAMGDIAPGVYQ